MNLKSFIARVTKSGSRLQGARRRAERRHADQVGRSQGGRGPVAAGDAGSVDRRTSIGWKLFTYTWNGATPGEHTLVSRVDRRQRQGAADRRRISRTRSRSSRRTRRSRERSRLRRTEGTYARTSPDHVRDSAAGRRRRRSDAGEKTGRRPGGCRGWPTAIPICRAPTISAR